jgi:hypothetical protein
MLGDLHSFALGPITPILALIFATLGCLLGILLAARARQYTAWRRARFVAYATLSVAGAGLWQPAFIALLGLRINGSVIRVDLRTLGLALVAGMAASTFALLLLCYGRTGVLRVVGGGLLLAAGVAGTGFLILESVATGGEVGYQRTLAAAALGSALTIGVGLAWAFGMTRTLRSAVWGAVLLGIALTAAQLAGTASLKVVPGLGGPIPADQVPGLAMMRLGVPAIVVGGALTAMMWYFSVGTATLRDLRLIFRPQSDADHIEPWMIEQVRARVALSSTAFTPTPGWARNVWSESTVAVRSIPLVGGAVASAFSRARDAAALHAAGAFSAGASTTGPLASPSLFGSTTAESPAAGEPGESEQPETAPAWRPVPGWGVTGANRSPAPGSSSWWDPHGWEPAERNEAPVAPPGRATNSRQGPLPTRTPAPTAGEPQLVAAATDQESAPASSPNGSYALPRRNARP